MIDKSVYRPNSGLIAMIMDSILSTHCIYKEKVAKFTAENYLTLAENYLIDATNKINESFVSDREVAMYAVTSIIKTFNILEV